MIICHARIVVVKEYFIALTAPNYQSQKYILHVQTVVVKAEKSKAACLDARVPSLVGKLSSNSWKANGVKILTWRKLWMLFKH